MYFAQALPYNKPERRQTIDQIKIGRFIAQRRKSVNLTQLQLADKLNITDRAVSKWETAKAMPDTSIMLALCNVLQITVNDLLSGEVVEMDETKKIFNDPKDKRTEDYITGRFG